MRSLMSSTASWKAGPPHSALYGGTSDGGSAAALAGAARALDQVVRGVQRLDGGPQHGQRIAVDGHADGRGAQPVGAAVTRGEGGGAADADERVPRPRTAVLGGFEQEGAGPFGGELAVE